MEDWSIIQSLLFERALWFVGLLVVVEYGLIVVWLRRRTSRLRVAALIGLVICIVVPLIQYLVTTQRERVSIVCAALVTAVDAGDVAAIDSHVSADFAAEDFDKASFMSLVRQGLERVEIEDATLEIDRIEIVGNRAIVVFRANCTIISDIYEGPRPSKWRAVFEREGDAWRMIEVKPVSTPMFQAERLSELPV